MTMRPFTLRTTLKPIGLIILCALCACGGPTSPASAPHVDGDTLKKTAPAVPPAAQQDTLSNGHEKIRRPDGHLLMAGDKLDGQRNGIWTSYNDQGRVQSRNEYDHGVLQGQSVVFRDNGALYYTGEHRNGKQVGEWKFYDEQGNLTKTVEYDTLGNMVQQP